MQIIGGRFQLEQQIGSGGMGAVYRGLNCETGEAVAIKHLKPEFLAGNQEMVTRFIREGEALRQLNHPNIVKMLAAIQEDNQYYLMIEYMSGGSLADLLQQTPKLSVNRVLDIVLDLADALTRAHRLNIIHRDIKPDNVLMATDGTPRLTDFGIARYSNSEMTETGIVIGTVAYVPPEVLNGEPIDERGDIWSFGVLLFEMLAGQRPFQGATLPQLIQQIVTASIPDLEVLRPDVPIGLIDLVYRMLAKNASERISSVRLVGVEVEALLKGFAYASPSVKSTAPDDATAIVDSRFATPTPALQAGWKHNLPAQITAFVGREHELAELQQLLQDQSVRLVDYPCTWRNGKNAPRARSCCPMRTS
jgi:serine/threonine protein kinase